jgi:hypothetical protein
MDDRAFEELSRLLSSPLVGDRLQGMDRISIKSGRQVVSATDDDRVVEMLIQGLDDPSRRVQRAAARGLRPWVARDPDVLEGALTAYATNQFAGGYSHAGLRDTRTGAIWVPKFQATKGHAALLRDGNTDRYFKFEFFVPGQGPLWAPEGEGDGHLLLYFIPEWSFSRQKLIPEFDERLAKHSLREQERHSQAVQAFYREAQLPYAVRVHYVYGGGGHHRRREVDVARIESTEE